MWGAIRLVSVCALIALGSVMALGGGVAQSASGSAVHAANPGRAVLAPLVPARRDLRGTTTTRNSSFGGYEAFQTGSSSAVTQFKVPATTCTSTDSGVGPGAFVIAGPSGSETFDGAGLLVQCVGGSLVIDEALIVGSTETNFADPVVAGDTIKTSVTVGAGGTTVSVFDLTHKFTLTENGTDTSADAELLGDDSLVSTSTGQQLPIPSFSAYSFLVSTVGGAALATLSPTKLIMVNGCSVVLNPGAISGTGTNFTVAIPKVDITSISPVTAVTGTVVTITGAGFNSSSTVTFAGVPATSVTHVSASELQATVPLTASTGAITIKNTTAPLGSVTSGCIFGVAPKITSFTPASGITGSSVTINGSGFKGTNSVKFGTRGAKFTFVSTAQITAIVPNAAVPGKISVTNSAGSAATATSFTPTLSITGIAPSSGPFGTVVTIAGVGFNSSSAVKFNGIAATSVTHTSSTQLKATVPSTATTGPITVTNTVAPTGTVQSAPSYTVTPHVAPTVTSFTPTSGITGSQVVLTGTNFSGASAVKFGTLPAAAFTIVSATSIKATVPNGAVAAKISVTTAAGTGTSAANFTPTLSITSFTPATGAAGTVVTINGIGFTATSTVSFNGTAASTVSFVSASQLKATVPAGVTTGRISLTNTTAPVGTVLSRAFFG